jgi:hypothetical protein
MILTYNKKISTRKKKKILQLAVGKTHTAGLGRKQVQTRPVAAAIRALPVVQSHVGLPNRAGCWSPASRRNH